MARNEVVLRVFVAFPDDLSDEVGAIEALVEELNPALSRDLGRRLEVITWRNAGVPGVGADPQAVINEQFGENYDIFIGILWTRFGTPTPRAGSGAEEEFERAYARHETSPGSVRVMIYFKRAPVDYEDIVPAQIEAINTFRSKLGPKGVLYWDFSAREEFESYLRMHLSRQASDWGKTWGTVSSSAQSQARAVPSGEDVEEGMLDLIERGTEGLGIAAEALGRIAKLQEQISARTEEKAAQLSSLPSIPEPQRRQLSKQIFSAVAVDLEQFAKGLSSETSVLSRHFASGTEAFSKSLTYTEFNSLHDVEAVSKLRETLRETFEKMEVYQKIQVDDLRKTFQGLPRVTTDFNRAKRSAVSAIDNFDRFAKGALELLAELRRNVDALPQA